MSWKAEYTRKLVSANEAIKAIKDGDKVVMSFGCGEPRAIVRAMRENYKDFHNVQVINMLLLGETPWVDEEVKGHFSYNSFFASGTNRKAISDGVADFTTCYLSEAPMVLRDIVKPRVTVMSVTPPDSEGYVSLGTNCDYIETTLSHCEVKIGQVNKYVPYMSTEEDGQNYVEEIYDDFIAGGGMLNEEQQKQLVKLKKEICDLCNKCLKNITKKFINIENNIREV